ncbi:MAG: hypothetical protein HY904_23235 [Deltaproteobacteria bacterium]|nr:hypothetical protein [Deltaproteobacteria bacterium]
MPLPVVNDDSPLCQGPAASCAACCGVFNFADRSPHALHARLEQRTARVTAAGWDLQALTAVARALSLQESPQLLFRAVRTCPLAGFLNEERTRVGCLIHPRRHPAGADLRDLGAYGDRTICAGHLCAPHTWMTAADRALLAAAPGWRAYSMAVGETGFVKAVLRHVANRRGGEVHADELANARVRAAAARVLALFDAWPWADPDPRRFGGFSFAGDDAYTREVPSAGRFPFIRPNEATLLDALGSRLEDEATARAALDGLVLALRPLVEALGG